MNNRKESVLLNNVFYYRKLAKLSQEELSKKSTVSRTTISNLENNIKVVITNATMKKIAKALNRTVYEVFYDELPNGRKNEN